MNQNGYPKGAQTKMEPPTTKAVKSPFADHIPGLTGSSHLIDVTEKMPTVNEPVLLYHVDGFFAVGHLELWDEGRYEWWYHGRNYHVGVYENKITHWQPFLVTPQRRP